MTVRTAAPVRWHRRGAECVQFIKAACADICLFRMQQRAKYKTAEVFWLHCDCSSVACCGRQTIAVSHCHYVPDAVSWDGCSSKSGGKMSQSAVSRSSRLARRFEASSHLAVIFTIANAGNGSVIVLQTNTYVSTCSV